MGRKARWLERENALSGTPESLRKYWQECNRHDKLLADYARASRKARDKKRAKCRCEAYPWPHRPGGGLCRWPEPPQERWQPKQMRKRRPHGERYIGLRRQLARASGLHPIRDRALIEALMPTVLAKAKELKRQTPRVKYRNIRITYATVVAGNISFGLEGKWQTAGPMM